MDTIAIRTLLHNLSNALNAAKINAYLLRMLHGDNLDNETMASLDSSLFAVEELICDARQRLQSDSTSVHEEQHDDAANATSK